MDYKRYIAQRLKIDGVTEDEIYSLITPPPDSEMGDFALPCFRFAKIFKKSPALIAELESDAVLIRSNSREG